MGKFIIKLDDYYLEWSTVVDAPTTYGMKYDDFLEYYKHEYGESGVRDLPQRLLRVDKNGTSALYEISIDDLIGQNRAGPNGSQLTKQELIQDYCLALHKSPAVWSGKTSST